MFKVDWYQHPVGHGGFHTGAAYVDQTPVFRWIFDCGARRTSKFDADLRTWTEHLHEPVDWLFISHFDTDHVSGLETLMSRAVVRNVMVPYVDQAELAYLLAYESARGRLSRPFVELIADPAGYLLSRGATGVTFLGGPEPVAPEEFAARDPDPDSPRGWLVKIDPPPRILEQTEEQERSSIATGLVQMVEDSVCEMVGAYAGGVAGLHLRPCRLPLSDGLHDELLAALTALVGMPAASGERPGLGGLAFAIANHARTATGRAGLRAVFKAHVGSSNRSSMSLLTIPFVASDDPGIWSLYRATRHHWGSGVGGWLNTGDAELRDPLDLDNWYDAYANDLPMVRMLALPHHGSDRNSGADLQALCPKAVFAAHVKANGKKHPGLEVMEAAGDRLSCVTEHPATGIHMTFRSP